MLQHLTLFLAPEAAAQATMTSPPALAGPARRLPILRWRALRLVGAVIADALGFMLLFAGGWLMLAVLQALLGLA